MSDTHGVSLGTLFGRQELPSGAVPSYPAPATESVYPASWAPQVELFAVDLETLGCAANADYGERVDHRSRSGGPEFKQSLAFSGLLSRAPLTVGGCFWYCVSVVSG